MFSLGFLGCSVSLKAWVFLALGSGSRKRQPYGCFFRDGGAEGLKKRLRFPRHRHGMMNCLFLPKLEQNCLLFCHFHQTTSTASPSKFLREESAWEPSRWRLPKTTAVDHVTPTFLAPNSYRSPMNPRPLRLLFYKDYHVSRLVTSGQRCRKRSVLTRKNRWGPNPSASIAMHRQTWQVGCCVAPNQLGRLNWAGRVW